MNRKGIIYSALIFIIGLIIGFTFRSVFLDYTDGKQVKADEDISTCSSNGNPNVTKNIQSFVSTAFAASYINTGTICPSLSFSDDAGEINENSAGWVASYSLDPIANDQDCVVNTSSANSFRASELKNISINATGLTNYCLTAHLIPTLTTIYAKADGISTYNDCKIGNKVAKVTLSPTSTVAYPTFTASCSERP